MEKNWFVVQVFRGFEDIFVNRLNFSDDYNVFTPKQALILKRKDRIVKILKPLFPGYIFISTDLDFSKFKRFYQQHISCIDGCIKILKYNDEIDALMPYEREFIERFINSENIIDSSIGFIEGERIRIIEGPLVGNETFIKKINRHKRTAIIEIVLFGQVQSIELSCEILTKTGEIV